MIDLHTHVLPGLDDGAQNEQEALDLLRLAAADGTHTMVLTPHSGNWAGWRTKDDVGERVDTLQAAARDAGIAVRLVAGAEIMIEADVVERTAELVRLGDSRYVLVELPHDEYPESTDNVIFSLQLAGLVPVLAHPERNAMLQEQPTRLHEFVERGVLAQVTAQSIVGALGSAVQGTAELFLSCGLAHVIASDTHRADTRPPGLASAVEQAARICGPRFALAMVEDIPRRLLADQVLTFEPPAEPVPTRSWFGEATGMLRKALSGP